MTGNVQSETNAFNTGNFFVAGGVEGYLVCIGSHVKAASEERSNRYI